jgi:hypothetical protein
MIFLAYQTQTSPKNCYFNPTWCVGGQTYDGPAENNSLVCMPRNVHHEVILKLSWNVFCHLEADDPVEGVEAVLRDGEVKELHTPLAEGTGEIVQTCYSKNLLSDSSFGDLVIYFKGRLGVLVGGYRQKIDSYNYSEFDQTTLLHIAASLFSKLNGAPSYASYDRKLPTLSRYLQENYVKNHLHYYFNVIMVNSLFVVSRSVSKAGHPLSREEHSKFLCQRFVKHVFSTVGAAHLFAPATTFGNEASLLKRRCVFVLFSCNRYT